MSLCITDDCCGTEPVCSASESLLGSQFPAKNDVSRQIGAATQTGAARPQQKALDYTTLDRAWHDLWPVELALLLGAVCMYLGVLPELTPSFQL